MDKKIYLLLSCLLIASCTPHRDIVFPSDTLLSDCIINEPPLLTGSDSKDKVILATAWSNQTSAAAACQKKVKLLQTWKRIQQERLGVK